MNDKGDPIVEYLSQEGMVEVSEYEDKQFLIFHGWEGVHLMYSWFVSQAKATKLYRKALAADERPDYHHGKQMIHSLRLGRDGLFPHSLGRHAPYLIPEKVQKFLDKIEYSDEEWGFDDEWSQCANCGRVIRSSPDSYSWYPDYLSTEDGLYCPRCFDLDDYLQVVEDKVDRDEPIPGMPYSLSFDRDEWTQVKSNGYRGEWENGLHGGQTDNPDKQARLVRKVGEGKIQVLFDVSPSQFDVSWTTWIRWHPDETDIDVDIEEIATQLSALFQTQAQDRYDRAELMKRALQNIPGAFTRVTTDTETGEISYQDIEDEFKGGAL